MKLRAAACVLAIVVATTATRNALGGSAGARTRARNVVLFVADGLRPSSLNPTDAPTLVRLQSQGVFFANSHSLYPTVTTANASALATGHQLGDTGDFANTIYSGAQVTGSGTPFIEDDAILAELDAQTGGNYLGEKTLLAVARARGFSTAAIGKVGPTLIQDVSQGDRSVKVPGTIVIDDRTGTSKGVPLDPAIAAALTATLGSATPPARNSKPPTRDDNGYSGTSQVPGTSVANVRQQQFLADAVTKVILPELEKRGKPFVLVFWSRDPDATQHNQGDSLGDLAIGINGPTSKAAVHNADDTLRQILAAVESDAALAATTDVVVTSDHGFSTISRREVDAEGHASRSSSTKRRAPDVRPGDLPPGFVAIDVATHLGLKLCDPDRGYAPIGADEHPSQGNGLIGPSCAVDEPRDGQVIVAANGGTDLIYVPDGDAARIADVATFLLGQDYVDGVFVDGGRNALPGALSLRDINLAGSALLPAPSIVVALKRFSRDPRDPIRTEVDVSDTTLQQGQGGHGSFGPADVTNTMIAFGPDFKTGFVDRSPASNADLPLTLARILGLTLPSRGKLRGRVLVEAITGGPPSVGATCGEAVSAASKDGLRTALHFQMSAGVRYLDAAKKFSGPIDWAGSFDGLPCNLSKHDPKATTKR
ncbi:MAG TPA: alkaline phosphatase family protein [Polyangia bacterium]|nr:alkaline phosphatase family protein [Polyangia bacterium]